MICRAAGRCRRAERSIARCALALTRIEDFAASNPAPGELIDLEAGAYAPTASSPAVRGRIVLDRGITTSSASRRSPRCWRRPLPLEARDDRALRRAHQPRRLRRLPRAGAPPAAFAIETLIDELAAELGLDPIELRLRNVMRQGDRGSTASPSRSSARPSAWSASGAPAVAAPGRAARRRGRRRGDRLVAGRPRARGGELSPGRRRPPDDRHRRRRHVRHRDDVRHDRRRGVRGRGGGRARRRGRHREHPVRRPERRQQGDLHRRARGAARRRRGARAPAPGRGDRARDRPRGPRGRRRRGPPGRRAEPRRGDRRPRQEGATFGSPYAPVEGYAGVAQTSRAPSAAAHLSHVRVDRETGAVTLLRRSSPRTSAGCSTRRSSRASSSAATARGSAGRSSRSSPTTSSASCAPARSSTTRSRRRAMPPIDLEIVEIPAPDGPFGAKGIGEAPVIAARCGRQRDRGRDGRAPARAADDPAAGLGCDERLWAMIRGHREENPCPATRS